MDRLDRQDLVGSLIITNCRVVHTLEELLRQTGCRGHPTGDCLQVWALDRDRTTYNVSVPHRAHVAALLSFHWTCQLRLCGHFFVPQGHVKCSYMSNGLQQEKLQKTTETQRGGSTGREDIELGPEKVFGNP